MGTNSNLADRRVASFDKFIFYACILDILFLPYVWFISIPYTMPLLYVWFIMRFDRIVGMREFRIFVPMFLLMVFSTLFGCVTAPVYIYNNLVYLVQYTSLFLYYFVFSHYINHYDFEVKNILIIFIVFVTVMAVIYNIDKASYQSLKLFWNLRSGITINETMYEGYVGYRYAFIWMDPNNVAYMMNALLLYLWCNERLKLFSKLCTLISVIFILVSCMSSGGLIAFGMSILLYISAQVWQILKGRQRHRYRIRPLDLLMFVITACVLIYIITKIPEYLKTGIALESMDRIRSNSGESRLIIWNYVIKNVNFLKYILIGRGGVTLVQGVKYAPHNGHLYWILGYGFIAYLQFMYLVFRKRKITLYKEYIWMLPLLFGFTVNVMLGETKLIGILLLLVACSSSGKYLKRDEQ